MTDVNIGKGEFSVGRNPILGLDYPDPDVIFHDGAFYMVSTTMHYMPGCEILRSYDLINWEHFTYVYHEWDSTPARRLEGDGHIYGKGMWAATLRYHDGTFYIVFVANDTRKTYLYRAEKLDGPWRVSEIEGFYHDCSLLFDDDRIFIVYGNRQIYLTELDKEMKGPLKGGLHRMIVEDSPEAQLGYEGSHLYKIGGRYYLFMIHSTPGRWRRVEGCFSADWLEGEFTGGEVYNDDLGLRDSGAAQGGIVEGPEGVWHAIVFQDSGAIGRIPVVVPVTWEDGRPVFGTDGKAPLELRLSNLKPGHIYKPLVDSDDFKDDSGDSYGFKSCWQFNHEPKLSLIERDLQKGEVRIRTDKVSRSIFRCLNTMTQRTHFPDSSATVIVDASDLREGDVAGIAAFQGDFAYIGVTVREGRKYITMCENYSRPDLWKFSEDTIEEKTLIPIDTDEVKLRVICSFSPEKDEARVQAFLGNEWQDVGPGHKLSFRLDHFTGCRFGLFMMSQKAPGGSAGFREFIYGL